MMYSEQFNTTQNAKVFKKISQTSPYIPTTIYQYDKSCLVQTVQPIQFSALSTQKRKQYLSNILNAIQHAISHNIYHIDLKIEHFGVKNNRAVLLDWNDAVFTTNIKPKTFHVTHIPSNIQNILQNPTHKTLLNGIISQLGFIFHTLNIIQSKDIYEKPEEYQFIQLYKKLNV